MEDFGDYIYLIVIAIAALSSLFKKKKPALNAPLPPDDELNDIDRELRELFEEQTFAPEPANIPEPIVVPSTKTSVAPQKASHKIFDAVNDNMEQRIIKPSRHKTVTEAPEEFEPELLVQLETVEQARLAFIHSEIFNRK